MLPSSVAKCMTTNYYAIIYDHDHSKHINDRLRCRQDNGATCLNCKVDFSLEMLTTAPHCSSPPPLAPNPHTFEMQAVWVSHSARPPISHSHYLCSLTHFPSLPTFLSLSLWVFFHRALVWSKTALWHCVRHAGSRKHQTTKEQLTKRQTQRDRGAHASVCMPVYMCVISKWIN